MANLFKQSHRKRSSSSRNPIARQYDKLEDRALLTVNLLGVPDWLAQGASPASLGQVENINDTGGGINPVTGAIHTIALHPTDSDIMYLGSTNGGVWKSTDFTSVNPTYTPMTDQFPGLSIGALEYDPTDASFNTLIAGVGRFSSIGQRGGPQTGLLATTDDGASWSQLGVADLTGTNISGVAPRGNTILVSANSFGGGTGAGVYRSIDGGDSFQLISGLNNLAFGAAFDLVGDPNNLNRLYVSVQSQGLFRTDDLGDSWVNVSSGDASLNSAITIGGNNNTEMAVAPTTSRVYTGVIRNGRPIYIGFSDNLGGTWTEMDLPNSLETPVPVANATNTTPIVINSPGHGRQTGQQVQVSGVLGNTAANGNFTITAIDANNFSLNGSSGNGAYAGGGVFSTISNLNPRQKPGGQGGIHFSILVDPGDEDIVYIGGDRQDTPFVNSIGATDFTGRLFRGDAGVAAVNPGSLFNVFSPQWAHLTHTQNAGFAGGGTANGSAPHADSREMLFRADGILIQSDDGGLYGRTSPQDNTGDWFSLLSNAAGGLQVGEMHDIAYDSNSNIIMSGNQDTGTQEQIVSAGPTRLEWRSVSTADGGDVAVDNISLAGQSIRYSSRQNLGGFQYRIMNAANAQVGATIFPALNPGADPAIGVSFVTPFAVNEVAGDRLIIGGTNGIYESFDRGENVAQISTNAANSIGAAIAYGANGNAEALYVGSGNTVLVRTAAGPLTQRLVSGPGFLAGTIRDVVIDPNDEFTAYVMDSSNVYMTTDAGVTWSDITGDLADTGLNALAYVTGAVDFLLAAGSNGVSRLLSNAAGIWTEFGSGLPNAPAFDMDYDAGDDVLVVGTLGRGAWSVANASSFSTPGVLQIYGDMDFANQDDVITLTRNANNPLLLDVNVNGADFGPYQYDTIQQINVFGLGANDTLIVDSTNGLIDVANGIRFDGGTGFDTLSLAQIGGSQFSETIVVGATNGSGTDTIFGAGGTQFVQYENLEPIITNVMVASLNINGGTIGSLLNADNAITYQSSDLFGPAWGRITIDAFEPIHFVNKTSVNIEAENGNDSIVFNNPNVPTGLSSLNIDGGPGINDHLDVVANDFANTLTLAGAFLTIDAMSHSISRIDGLTLLGRGGSDTFNIVSTLIPVTISGGTGDDTITISSTAPGIGGNLDGIAAPVNVGGGPGENVLTLDNTTGAPDIVTVHQSSIVGMTPFPLNYNAAGGSFTVNLIGSDAGIDSFNVASFLTENTLNISGLGGADLFEVQTLPYGDIVLDGGDDDDTYLVRMSGEPRTITVLESIGGGTDTLTVRATSADDMLRLRLLAGLPTVSYMNEDVSWEMPVENVFVEALSGNDIFRLETGLFGATLVGGGGGMNTVIGPNTNSTWNLTGLHSGDIPTSDVDFTSIEIIRPGTAVDTINLVGSPNNMIIYDQGGEDTIFGPDLSRIWTLTGPNEGNVNFNNVTWTGIENLTGGARMDRFVFEPGSSLNEIDGGNSRDQLIYSALAGPIDISLTSFAFGGFSGTATGLVTGFMNIGRVEGSASNLDEINGMNVDSIWLYFPTLSRYVVGTNRFFFSSIENLQGGSARDFFIVSPPTDAPLNLDGGLPSTVPGDTLRMNFAGVDNPDWNWLAPGVGNFTATNRMQVNYSEIEVLDNYDFGDADDSFGTLLASDGARHRLPALTAPIFLGAGLDPEGNGKPGPTAIRDDLVGTFDDEDGVIMPGVLLPHFRAAALVTA
ncbi:MAG: hypothetical protein AAF456_20305, partial [Planctomycetota bacterium]